MPLGRSRFVPILFLVFCAVMQAQSGGGERLDQGLSLFERSDFAGSLSVFQGLLLDAKAKAHHPAAAYWSALAFVGLKDYQNADRQIGLFLAKYQGDPLYADALYQQGRIAYLAKDNERALRTFQTFLESFPDSDLYASALFWSGECLFQLGRLEQAERVFQAIVKGYPEGVKTEAANYRLNLIDLKYREDELLMLLKWSHEESLRIVEEYQRREKAYEQAVNAYQRQWAGQKAGTATSADLAKLAELQALSDRLGKEAAEKDARLAELSSLVEDLQRQLEQNRALASTDEKDARIADLAAKALALEKQLTEARAKADSIAAELASSQSALASTRAALASAQAVAPATEKEPVAAPAARIDDSNLRKLLTLKQQALELNEFYLKWLSEKREGGSK